MRRIIALFLIISILIVSLIGCANFGYYSSGNISSGLIRKRFINAKVVSDKRYLNKNDATVDFSYAFYFSDSEDIVKIKNELSKSPDEREKYSDKEHTFGIYLSNNTNIAFERDDLGHLSDYENVANAMLYKYFTFEEAYGMDYGFTESSGGRIQYDHSEKLTVPAELFDPSQEEIYINIIQFTHNVEEDFLYGTYGQHIIKIRYKLLGKESVVFIDN